jgi:hypothetical protein
MISDWSEKPSLRCWSYPSFFFVFTWVVGNPLRGIVIKDQAAAGYELASWAAGPWTAMVLAWATATAVGLSNALPTQVAVSRVIFTIGRDRQLPQGLARIHPKYHTPNVSMLASAALAYCCRVHEREARRSRVDRQHRRVERVPVSSHFRLGILWRSPALFRLGPAWAIPLCGILVVLAVLSGMSAPAMKVGTVWTAAGLAYALVLKTKHREDLRVPP